MMNVDNLTTATATTASAASSPHSAPSHSSPLPSCQADDAAALRSVDTASVTAIPLRLDVFISLNDREVHHRPLMPRF
jgi:hypothetical protein